MRAIVFLISLFLLLLSGNGLDASTISRGQNHAFVNADFKEQFIAIENEVSSNEKYFLFCDEIDDEEENSAPKKYKELGRYGTSYSSIHILHNYYNFHKVTAHFVANTSRKYILLRTLRI